MTLTQLAPPYPIFTDKSGTPLDNGYLYFGTVNLNPETNPITVYYDTAFTQPAAQPLRTSNGYVMRNGSPAAIYTNGYFSVTVRDKNKSMVIYSPSGYGITPGTSASSTDQMTYNEGSTGAVNRILTSRLQDYVSVKDFGAVGNGIADDTAAIQAAINTAGLIHIPQGTYKITASLTVPSNTFISGAGDATIIQVAADNVNAFFTGTAADKVNISIENLLIDGGGQTTDIYTGYKNVKGFYILRATKVRISNVSVRKCGVIKSAGDPKTDNGWGGYGIHISARNGDITDVVIDSCRVTNIAGGGGNTGDGICIAGYKAATATTYQNVIVRDCYVSTVGRHCYTADGILPESEPSGVKFFGCYGEKSALDGIDLEDANDVVLSGCTFRLCGNDQTYYNPVAEYGATYRLLAAIAHGNSSVNFKVQDCTIDGCYYGITFGGGAGLSLSNCTAKNSTVSDIKQGLANAPLGMRILNCSFQSTGQILMDFYSEGINKDFVADGCNFASLVRVPAMSDSGFYNCTFKAGFSMSGGSAFFRRVTFDACTWLDFAGVAVLNSGANNAHPDVIFNGCEFLGTGTMTYGIQVGFNSSKRWVVKDCKFTGQTTAAIVATNGAAIQLFAQISDNDFVNCAAGIDFTQPVNDCVISSNTFNGITGYCISYSSIFGGADMRRVNIVSNLAASGCTNGVRIATSTGTWDYSVVALNNMNGCTGTKWSVSAGNANGFTVNNIIT